MPIRIKNYEEFKAPLDATEETDITFEEKGDDFVFEVDGEEYSLSKLNKNLIDVYQMQNEKMNLMIKFSEEIENLKEDVKKDNKNKEDENDNTEKEKKNKEDKESKEELKLETIDDYINAFKERKKATRHNKRYEDGKSSLDLVHNTAKDAIDELKDKKKSIRKAPKGHTSIFDKAKYDAKLEKMGKIRDKATDSERPTVNFQAHDLDDAKRNNEYNKETINYQEEFNGILKVLATDKYKIKDYENLTKYFQDVIDGTIEHPSQEPFLCKHREDYKYLMSLKTKYPTLKIVVNNPNGHTETNNNTYNPLDETGYINDEDLEVDVQGNSTKDKIGDAIAKGGLISGLGQILNSGLEAAGVKLDLSNQQKNTLRTFAVIGGAIGLFTLVRKRLRKRKAAGKNNRKLLRAVGGLEAMSVVLGQGEFFSNTLGLLFTSNSKRGKGFGEFIKGNIKLKDLKLRERSGNTRPITTIQALGPLKPSDNIVKYNNNGFEVDDDKFETQLGFVEDNDVMENMKENYKELKAKKNKNEIITKSLKKLGITKEDIENPANKDKSFLEISADNLEKGKIESHISNIENKLEKKGREFKDSEAQYTIYLEIDDKKLYESDEVFDKLIEHWEKEGLISKITSTTKKEKTT